MEARNPVCPDFPCDLFVVLLVQSKVPGKAIQGARYGHGFLLAELGTHPGPDMAVAAISGRGQPIKDGGGPGGYLGVVVLLAAPIQERLSKGLARWRERLLPTRDVIPFSVFCFRFSVKKVRIISKLKLKFVAFETELDII